MNLIRREPARVIAVIVALFAVLSSFGLGLTSGQTGAIVALVGAGLALCQGEVTRSKVIPAKHPIVTHTNEIVPGEVLTDDSEDDKLDT